MTETMSKGATMGASTRQPMGFARSMGAGFAQPMDNGGGPEPHQGSNPGAQSDPGPKEVGFYDQVSNRMNDGTSDHMGGDDGVQSAAERPSPMRMTDRNSAENATGVSNSPRTSEPPEVFDSTPAVRGNAAQDAVDKAKDLADKAKNKAEELFDVDFDDDGAVGSDPHSRQADNTYGGNAERNPLPKWEATKTTTETHSVKPGSTNLRTAPATAPRATPQLRSTHESGMPHKRETESAVA